MASNKKGSLIVVGTGLQAPRHASLEAVSYIENSDKVIYLVSDSVSELWIKKKNKSAESLMGFYKEGEPRINAYLSMVDQILKYIKDGLSVCAVFYGHPGIFVFPSHEVIKQAKEMGIDARMLPSISAEDCLFADLGIDPARSGCQSYEATEFLIHKKKIDITSSLILWQSGMVGNIAYTQKHDKLKKLQILLSALLEYYNPNQTVIIYEASLYVICEPIIKRTTLSKLIDEDVSPISTLYIPPAEDQDVKVMRQPNFSYTRRK